MKLPKSSIKNHKKFPRVCHFDGCKNEFYGYKIQKYCRIHQDSSFFLKRRLQKKRMQENKSMAYADNFYIKYAGIESENRELICSTCGQKYVVTIRKDVDVYPKNCEAHRNAFKRELFLRKIKNPGGVNPGI